MKKLILVRYGNWEHGHVTDEGKQVMSKAAQSLEKFMVGTFTVVAARVDRATESANIITKHFNLPPVQCFSELYAADEEGQLPDVKAALHVLNTAGSKYDTVIAVVSREYIETLPAYILQEVFRSDETISPPHLNRGELLVLDFETNTITTHRHD